MEIIKQKMKVRDGAIRTEDYEALSEIDKVVEKLKGTEVVTLSSYEKILLALYNTGIPNGDTPTSNG